MTAEWQSLLIGAAITLATVVITQLLIWRLSSNRERATLRATKAAEAFVEFYDAMNAARSVRDFLDNPDLTTHPRRGHFEEQFPVMLDRVNRCRAMLAAVAPPGVIVELSTIEDEHGFYPGSMAARVALTEVAQQIRAGLSAGRVENESALNALLFGRLQDHHDGHRDAVDRQNGHETDNNA